MAYITLGDLGQSNADALRQQADAMEAQGNALLGNPDTAAAGQAQLDMARSLRTQADQVAYASGIEAGVDKTAVSKSDAQTADALSKIASSLFGGAATVGSTYLATEAAKNALKNQPTFIQPTRTVVQSSSNTGLIVAAAVVGVAVLGTIAFLALRSPAPAPAQAK